ncbi:MAG: exopolyphosphatase [Gammaproteobacteria bacterium]|nr:exopolyphosphatase [Gammaproteobacteria bacterium]
MDLGSNSFHMVIAAYTDGRLKVLERSREMVRLAAGLTASGKIPRKVAQRALACLRHFQKHLKKEQAATVRAVGTNALRNARNSEAFVTAGEKALGHPIAVISGKEEARLVFLGAAHSLPELSGQRLVVDIGGGSTELIIGKNLDAVELDSLELGCVTLTEEFFPGGKISEKRWRRARRAADKTLAEVADSLLEKGWDHAIGTSGTIRSSGKILKRTRRTDGEVTRKGIKKLARSIIAQEHIDYLHIDGLSTQRAAVFPGGVVILEAVLDALQIDCMEVSAGALREGLLYDMLHADA